MEVGVLAEIHQVSISADLKMCLCVFKTSEDLAKGREGD